AAQGDLDAWFACAQALRRYGGAWVSDSERAELREGVLRLVLGSRSQARSRLARLLESASLDAVVGDELAQNLESGDVDLADVFALTEYASARTLLDGVAGLGTAAPDDPECARLERAITAYTAPDDDSPIARQMRVVSELSLGSTQEERTERSGLVAELEQRYAALGCGYEGMAEPVSLAAAQELLGADELLVRYVLPYHALHPAYLPSVLVVTRTEARLVRLPVPDSGIGLIGRLSIDGRAPVDASPLGNEVVLARSAMDGGLDGDASPHLHRLYAMLVEPVLSTGLAANRNRWVIAPQRSLHLVPWMALQDASGRWLLDDAAVTIAPSASVWAALRRRPPRPAGALAAVGDPLVGYAGLPQLPGARAEVDHLAGLFQASGRPVRSLLGAAATYDGLVGAVQLAGLVHVATHGSFPEDGALFDHRILLSQDLGRPGPVTTDALRRLDLGAAWCVTLSVCNGGVFRVGPGDEPYGLVPAVLEAGSPTVVAAQWAVDDDAGRELMRRVADRIVEAGPAEALRGAVLEARRTGARPARDYTAFLAIGTGLGPAGDTSNVMEGRDR
ncbi:MAG TPA: CHAT domain-containing protein, partial [Candidatus Lustribacter sp.]|nr:CHAT domain-containing protein [Candidatus Lustribacter sp.]